LWHVRGKGQLHKEFWRGCLSEKKTIGVDGTILLKWVLRNRMGVDKIDLAYNEARWPPFVKVVIKVRFP